MDAAVQKLRNRNFVGSVRNALRVPPYSRLDMRVNRTFAWQEKRLTLYVEVINVYNRRNTRYASAGINGRTSNFTQGNGRVPYNGAITNNSARSYAGSPARRMTSGLPIEPSALRPSIPVE